MRIVKLFFSLLILLSFQFKGTAQEVTVRAELDTNLLLIGDQTILHLHLSQPKGKYVYWPQTTDKIAEKIEVLNVGTFDTTQAGTQIEIQVELLITSFDTGYLVIPPLPFLYDVINDSTYQTAETEPLLIGVFALKVDLEKGIADIKPIIDEPFTLSELLPYFIYLLILIAIILLGIYIWIRIKNNKPIFSLPKKPAIPAHITAIKNLDLLKSKKLWEQGDQKAYYSELTDIMRTYMEGQLNFSAMEMVTDDIIEELKNLGLQVELIDESAHVLQVSDFVKFAKTQALANENDLAIKWAYRFVETTKPDTEQKSEEEEVKS